MAFYVSDVQATSKTNLRVSFGVDVKQISSSNSNDSLNWNNYSITGGGFISVSSVIAIDTKTVQLTTKDMDLDASYGMVCSNIESISGNIVDSGAVSFSVLPKVTSIKSTSLESIEVEFSDDLKVNTDLFDLSSYSSSLGLVSVTLIAPNKLQFVTDEQTEDTLYTFNVVNGATTLVGFDVGDEAILLL